MRFPPEKKYKTLMEGSVDELIDSREIIEASSSGARKPIALILEPSRELAGLFFFLFCPLFPHKHGIHSSFIIY